MKNTLRSRALAGLLALAMLLSMTGPVLAASIDDFTDVPESHWAYDEIADTVERGLYEGTSETAFEPGKTMDRGMFVTVLSRLAEADVSETASQFEDVPEDEWYAGPVAWAAEREIVLGVSETEFAPEQPVTREQMVTLLVRYAEWAEVELPETVEAQQFPDADEISDYAVAAVAICQMAGIVQGMEDGTFAPGEDSNRAQVATVFSRFCAILDAVEEPVDPTDAPSDEPTDAPTDTPTDAPTDAPTDTPTDAPTDAPTPTPTQTPVGPDGFEMTSGAISVDSATAYTIRLEATGNSAWSVSGDVTSWFVDADGNPAFIDSTGAATAGVSGKVLTITLDAAKIGGFTDSGVVDLYLQVPTSAINAAGTVQVGTYSIPELEIDSNIFGSMFGSQDIDFEDTKATIKLNLDGLDNSRIDSSAAQVILDEGDGYYPSEFDFTGTNLSGSWSDGTTEYTLKSNDLTYTHSADGAGWTTLGGDGQGLFTFNLTVDGITYNGLPVASRSFRAQVYNYGRDFHGDALDLYGENPEKIQAKQEPLSPAVTPGSAPIWTWVADEDAVESDIPILCDYYGDNFYITWPTGVDASGLSASDITLTMRSEYGDEKVLVPETDYVVYYDAGVTQINVIYQNLPFIPVYSELEIVVDDGNGVEASNTYEIASVYVYYSMFGGNGAVRGWSFYGFDLETFTHPQQLLKPMLYTLKATDGTGRYYSETKGFVDSEDDATIYLGPEQRNVQLQGNYLSLYLLNEPNFPKYEKKSIDGVEYEFELIYNTENSGPTAVNTMLYNPTTLITERLDDEYYPVEDYPIPEPAPGYAIPWGTDNWITLEKWAWMQDVEIGWRTINVQYASGTINYGNSTPSITLTKGTTEQFLTPDITDKTVTWSITGNNLPGTFIDENGLLTIAADETASSITVYARTEEAFSVGAVNVTLAAAPTTPDVSVESDDIDISAAGSFEIELSPTNGTWNVADGDDVSSWFVDADGNLAFVDTTGAATAKVNGDTVTITLDTSKIGGFADSGVVDLYVQAPESAITSNEAYTESPVKVGAYTIPALVVDDSDFFVARFANVTGREFEYDPDSKAVLKLEGIDNLDNSKIDSSKAQVILDEGDGYYPEEFIFTGTKLDSAFTNGTAEYRMKNGDLIYDRYTMFSETSKGNNESAWTTLGGDGAGNFVFNLTVDGITYNGLPVSGQTFRHDIYYYGRDFALDAQNLYQNKPTITAEIRPLSPAVTPGDEPIWTWQGDTSAMSSVTEDGAIPILCDYYADDFYVTWPAGWDASALSAEDITLTLRSEQGDEKVLTPETDYVVNTDDGVTQIAVIYQNLPFIPVYTTLEFDIDYEKVDGATEPITTVYDVASVYVYYTQFGGSNPVRSWSFYGFENLDDDTMTEIINMPTFTLRNDEGKYYSEKNGGTLVDDVADATVFDASGPDYRNLERRGNHISLYQTINSTYEAGLMSPTETRELSDGSEMEFTLVHSGGSYRLPRALRDIDTDLRAAPGYAIPSGRNTTDAAAEGYPAANFNYNNWVTLEKWAWDPNPIDDGLHKGWISVKFEYDGTEISYGNTTPTITLERGTTTQFTPIVRGERGVDVTWEVIGASSDDTQIDENGLLTIGRDEGESITVYASAVENWRDWPFDEGAVNITLVEPEPPALRVESEIYGIAFTHGKSTLKNEITSGGIYEDGTSGYTGPGDKVSYEKGGVATLTLEKDDIDDSKIDSSNAVVTLVDGDGYYPEEYVLLADELTGEWKDGQITYALKEGDLEIDRGVYPQTADPNSGREWSCLGGDGQGNYYFNFEVSGIEYDGVPVESQTFTVHIYIYGNDYTNDASRLYGTSITEIIPVEAPLTAQVVRGTEPVWTWVSDGYDDIPVVCDEFQDDFYITWPAGVDASALTAEDITLTMYSAYGDEYVLEADNEYYVYSSVAGETQIAVTLLYWPFTPVYREMTIEVDGSKVSGYDGTAGLTETYDIASVYVYEAQQGGGGTTIDGTVTAYSFYGLANAESWDQLLATSTYTWRTGTNNSYRYYAIGAGGISYLATNSTSSEVVVEDGNGPDDRNLQRIGNTYYNTTRQNQTDEKYVVSESAIVEFTKAYSGGGLLSPANSAQDLAPEPGYVIRWAPNEWAQNANTYNWITQEKWAWQDSVGTGWTPNPGYESDPDSVEIVSATGTFTVELQATAGGSWTAAVTVGKDVTSWFVTEDGEPVFANTSGVATITTITDGVLTIELDASKIEGYTTNGGGDLYVLPPAGTISGQYVETPSKVGTYAFPEVKVDSDLYASLYTTGKSTHKAVFGEVLEFDPNTKAEITLDLGSLDADLVDATRATVNLTDGDGYYADEFIFAAESGNGLTQTGPGEFQFTLKNGDLEFNMDDYPASYDKNSGFPREWSCLGGDGQGNYWYNLTVSGLTYDGLPLADQTFRLHVYVYGINYTRQAVDFWGEEPYAGITAVEAKLPSAPTVTTDPEWSWTSADSERIILADNEQDNIYITWPGDIDASGLTVDDVTVTLKSVQGDTKVIAPEVDPSVGTYSNYSVYYDPATATTQIALTYKNFAFIPVYSTMDIDVTVGGETFSETFDVGSVYVYNTQQGGGGQSGLDGTQTAYSFYGIANLTDLDQIANVSFTYTLTTTDDDGNTVYYSEDGGGTLVPDIADATVYDATGRDDRAAELIGNTYVSMSRVGQTADKTLADNRTITFNKSYSGGGGLKSASTVVEEGQLALIDGYVWPVNADPSGNDSWIANEKWGWYVGVDKGDAGEGYTGLDLMPEKGTLNVRYMMNMAQGTEDQFTAYRDNTIEVAAGNLEWSIIGILNSDGTFGDPATDLGPGTKIDADGKLTIDPNEPVGRKFVVYAEPKSGVTGLEGLRGASEITVTAGA